MEGPPSVGDDRDDDYGDEIDDDDEVGVDDDGGDG